MATIPIEKLEYYQKQQAQHTMIARAVLLTVIFGMLGLNMWLTQRNYEALVINMDQTRLAQDQLHDTTTTNLAAMERQITALQATITLLELEKHSVPLAAVQ